MVQVTLQDVAARAGVSLGTVSRVLGGHYQPSWPAKQAQAARIRAIAEELGYRPDLSARAARSGRSRLVGLLQRSLAGGKRSHPSANAYLLGVDGVLTAAGYGTVLVDLRDGHEPLALRGRMLDGVVVVSQSGEEELTRIRERFSHAVWLDGVPPAGASAVLRDETGGIARLVELLAATPGLRRIRYLDLDDERRPHYSVAARRSALRAAAERLPAPLELCGDAGFAGRDRLFARLCAELRPGDCWLAYDGIVAEALHFAAAARGILSGRDVALVACDGREHFPWQWPQLTHLASDHQALGARAAQRLLDEIEGRSTPGGQVAVTPELHLGDSHLVGLRSG